MSTSAINDTGVKYIYDKLQNRIKPLEDAISVKSSIKTGNPLNFSTKFAQNAESTVIGISPIQNLHGYNKPWVGGAGANKWDEVWEMGAIRGANGENVNSDTKFRSKNFIPVTPGSTVYFVHPSMSSNTDCSYFFYQSDYTFISYADSKNSQEVQIPNNCAYIRFSILGTSYGNNIAINYPSTVTTYSPYENNCPISGRTEIGIEGCGVNTWDEEWEVGSYNITTGAKSTDNTRIRNKNKIPIKSNTAYCFSTQTSRIPTILWYDKYENFIGITSNSVSSAFVTTSPTNARYACFFGTTTYGTTYNNDICVNISDSSFDGQYTPYTKSNDLTIAFGQTIYGGSLDVENGVLTVDRGYKTVGDLNWTYVSANAVFYSADITNEKKAEGKTIISSDYQTLDNVTSAAGVSQDASVCLYRGTDANHRVYIKDTRYTDASTFKTTMSSVQLVYELATPITIQLTPHQIYLLKGANNISSDANTISLTYKDGILTVVEPATKESDGIMSATDKKTLDSISDFSTSTVEGNPVSFITDSKQAAKHSVIDIAPVQDLHGFTRPWTGGAGKNKLNSTLSTTSQGGLDYTSQGNGIYKINGTASSNGGADFTTNVMLKAGTYKILGLPSGVGSTNTYIGLMLNGSYAYTTNDESFTLSADTTFDCLRFRPGVGTQLNNVIVKPMISSDTSVTYDTYEPYENLCPISGRTEIGIEGWNKNLLQLKVSDIKTLNTQGTWSGNVYSIYGGTVTFNEDSSGYLTDIVLNGTFINEAYPVLMEKYSCSEQMILAVENADNTKYNLALLTSGNTGIAVTATETGATVNAGNYGRLRIRIEKSIAFSSYKISSMLCKATDGNTFEPYKTNTDLTITFGETVYGGSLDVEKGKLVVDKACAEFDGSEDEGWSLGSTSGTEKRALLSTLNPQAVTVASASIIPDAISNQYTAVSANNIFARIHGFYVSGSDVRVYDENRTQDLTAWKTYLASNPLQVCYELATPITIQLPPNAISLLDGINNILIDDNYSTITLTYRNGEVVTLRDLQDQSECHIYSTEERVVAKWIDGRPVYEKVVFFGEIPNGVSKEVAHNIDNFYTAINISGVGRNPDTGEINFAQQRDGASIWMTPTSIGTWGTRNWDGIDFYFYITYIKDE